VPRRELDQALTAALPEVERIRRLSPEATRVAVSALSQNVTLRSAVWSSRAGGKGRCGFGLGDDQEMLTPERWPALEKPYGQLETYRHPFAPDTKAKALPVPTERWLETMVAPIRRESMHASIPGTFTRRFRLPRVTGASSTCSG